MRAPAAWQIKKAMNKDLDIDVIPEAVDDVVHFSAPVVAPGLELLVLLRSARDMNKQTGDCSGSKHLGSNQKQSRVGREKYFFAAVLRS